MRPDSPVFVRKTVDLGLMAMRIFGVEIEIQENIRPEMKAAKLTPLSQSQLRHYRSLVDADVLARDSELRAKFPKPR